MPKSKKHLRNLFQDTDTNISLTIFSESSKKDSYFFYRTSWFSAIKDGLDNLALFKENVYHFQITSINGKVHIIHCRCCDLIDELRTLFACKEPTSFRIDIIEDSDISWIIIIKDDL